MKQYGGIMNSKIISVEPVVMRDSKSPWGQRTVIYEVDGERYRGCVNHLNQYYFGGGGNNQPHLSDIDKAFAIGFPAAAKEL